MFGTVMQILGLLGVAVSIVILAWQTRRLTQQTRASNLIATASLNHSATALLHGAWSFIAHDPALRPHFYDKLPCPEGHPNHAKALMVAEMAADAASFAILIAQLLPQTRHEERRRGDWSDTARFIVQQPIVQEIVRAHPRWWPALMEILPSLESRPHASDSGGESHDCSGETQTMDDDGGVRET